MPTLTDRPRFPDDDGSADPRSAAALAAFAAGSGSEHAALSALARSRLLVPVVSVPAAKTAEPGPGPVAPAGARKRAVNATEMALPKLVGQDGRSAILAFTCLDSLNRWRPGARPVPAEAAAVWRAAAEDSCAVVIDIAGPVPLAVEGARLAALAEGGDAPLPQDDPDVRHAFAAAVAEQAPAARFRLLAGDADGDLLLELDLPAAAAGGQAAEIAARVGSAAMARLGSRLRRGVAVVLRAPRSR